MRALVVDDSVVVRRTVATVLAEADDIEVVTASDGRIGLRRCAELNPDVITLDVEMPGLTGLETLAEIRKDFPTVPVIMYSTLTARGAEATLDALALGAVDYATKPEGAISRDDAAEMVRQNLLPLVKLWGKRRASTRIGTASARRSPPLDDAVPAAPAPPPKPKTGPLRLVVVGVSTGGPAALATVMPMLPENLRVPVVIVQHMPPVFTAMLAERLDGLSNISVTEAVDGEVALPGHAYIAPGGKHLEVVRYGASGFSFELTENPPENSCRPAVDVLFRTAAAAADGHLLGVVLTGMGQDGLLGARDITQAGGEVIAQDEATSVVWGMPGYVVRERLGRAVPLDEVARTITGKVARQ
ncbi:MAG TPA: chemotaxis-specific protein-glutamate methyltransferase CheB [Acidimicrobiales bacterium]|nr:chemotaxis-specific protein-glutamate methyltransferase CheB [Acidimicrobiales bacterium]